MIDKACVTSAGRLVGEATIKNAVPRISNLDTIVRVQDGAGKKGQGELELRLSREKVCFVCLAFFFYPDKHIFIANERSQFTLDTVFDVVDPTISAAVSYSVNDQFTLGGYAKFDTKYDDDKSSAQFTDYDVAVQYAHKEITAVGATKSKLSEVTLSLFQDVGSGNQVGFMSTLAVKGEVKDFAVGAMYNIDADSKLQTKVDNKGLVWANYIQLIRPGVKGIASVQVDALNFAGDSHKFGLSLILG